MLEIVHTLIGQHPRLPEIVHTLIGWLFTTIEADNLKNPVINQIMSYSYISYR